MTRQEVLERLCLLCTGVAGNQFASMEPSDCFCGNNEFSGVFDYQFGEPVIEFIEEAVQKAMNVNSCPESNLTAWGMHLLDRERKP